MIAILSPSKTLDFESELPTREHTKPRFLDDAEKLVDRLRDYDEEELGSLMDINEDLAELNVARFQQWERPFTLDNARQALVAFAGHVYRDIETDEYSDEDFSFAQKHVRILSGLYGVLRPLDLMQPYRLEMGTRLNNPRGDNLYEFWDDRIGVALNDSLDAQGDDILVNLASKEYFKAVDEDALQARIIQPIFQQRRDNGDYRIIAVYAKLARGTMTDWMVRERVTDPEDLKNFDLDGYYYDEEASSENDFVFLRDEKP